MFICLEPKTDEPKAKKGRTRKAVETTEKDVLVDGESIKDLFSLKNKFKN